MNTKDRNEKEEMTMLERALAKTDAMTSQIIKRAREAEERINILRKIQMCVDSSEQHDWGISSLKWKLYPFEADEVRIKCKKCVCAMFVGRGDNRVYVSFDGIWIPLEEYLIPPEERDATEGEE